ncbi:MAG: PIN domain-containing protein [Pyrinomonadaceae bacterium MAG19_C2-C3]|nr:PIN domain-containing protein [Pyrinomonadaceae bacterium MAG19_C2-C3]
MPISVYLDVCCLQRPFDDLSQVRVRLEAEAVALILSYVEENRIRLFSSEAIEYEVNQITNQRRANRVQAIMMLASHRIASDEFVVARAAEMTDFGFAALDALHLACAEASEASVFLTTDDKLLKRALRLRAQLSISTANPVTWLQETEIP